MLAEVDADSVLVDAVGSFLVEVADLLVEGFFEDFLGWTTTVPLGIVAVPEAFTFLVELSINLKNLITFLIIIYYIHFPPMDAILFPGRLRPGKRIASIGRRLFS